MAEARIFSVHTSRSKEVPPNPESQRFDAVMVGLAQYNELGELQLFVTTTTREDKHILTFPGGKQEDGETPQRTAAREIQEEIGTVIALETLIPVMQAEVSDRTGKNLLVAGFVTEAWTGTPHSKKSQEVMLSGFMTKSQVQQLMEQLNQHDPLMLAAFDAVEEILRARHGIYPPSLAA